MSELIILAGPAGSGKSTVQEMLVERYKSKNKSISVIDPDVWFGPMERQLMKTLELNPNDRDSKLFKQYVRPYRYAGLWNGIELMLNGTDVLAVAPFTQEIRTGSLWDTFESRLARHQIKVLWLTADEAIRFERIKKRNRIEDDFKIKNWELYLKSTFEPNPDDDRLTIIYNNELSDVEYACDCIEGVCELKSNR